MKHSIARYASRYFIGAALVAVSFSPVARAQQAARASGEIRALIIGIDDYRYVPRLKGAIADARDLETSMRKLGAKDVRVMLDASVTRGSLLIEFENLVVRSRPGDTVFLTLSGHGAQEPERVKGSEPDGMDEVFLLPGFDPKDRERFGEKILDKEFNHFIKRLEDKGARVVFVADTCSGGGLARDVDPRAEEMSYRAVKYTPIEHDLTPVSTRADAFLGPTDFKATNFLAAVDKHSKVPEIRVPGGGYRGALSYAIARGLEGPADLNGDGSITASELFEYAGRVSYQLSDQRQKIITASAEGKNPVSDVIVSFDRGIAVLPVQPGQASPTPAPTQPAAGPATARPGGAQPPAAAQPNASGAQPRPPTQAATPTLPAAAVPPTADSRPKLPAPAPNAAGPVRVASLDGQASRFTGLVMQTPFEVVAPTANPDLLWDPVKREALAGGDVIARNIDRNDLPSVIERMAAVRWLKLRAAQSPQPIHIAPNDKLHRKGATVDVEIGGLAGRSLILFNIAGDGTVQMIYPLGSDSPMRTEAKYRLPLQVREPLGADQIVAVSASRSLPDLERALRQLDRRRNPMRISELITQFAGTDATVGSAGLFTGP